MLIDEVGEQLEGLIREKAKFPMIRGPAGEVQRAAFSRYFVRVHYKQDEEVLLDDKHLRRDRKVFTKQNLRAFLKHSLQQHPCIAPLRHHTQLGHPEDLLQPDSSQILM